MPSSAMPASRTDLDQQPPAAITAAGLHKSYGDKTVLDGIDLHIPTGTVFALLGPNGAG
ncbi:ABC transporter, partial [Kitasatospora sp. NPDC007106]